MISKFGNLTPIALSVLFLAAVTPAQQTSAQVQVLRNPDVNYPVHSDSSAPLSEGDTAGLRQEGIHPAPEMKHPKWELQTKSVQRGLALADGALQTSSGPLVASTPGLNLLGVGNGFPNYTVPDAPPDVNLAVGDTQVVQWVNVSFAVFDKTTGAIIAGPIQGNQFWAGFGGPCESNNSGDIIVQWDKIAHRWVMAQNVYAGPPYYTCVAISQTADATGGYYRYQFNQPYGFPDYPKWGIWPDAYYQSENNFGPAGNTYLGAIACAYERAKLLVGDSKAQQICFTTGTFDDNLLPGDLDSAGTLPPTGQPEVYLGSINNGTPTIYEYLFHVDFTTPSNSTFTGVGGTIPVPGVSPFSLACGGFSACVPQGGVPDLLDSLGDRLMYRLAYRNFSDHQTWLVSHSVNAGSSVGQRWYEFRAPETSTSLSVFQQGTFAPDSNYRWMGSIAMDGAQDIALGYSISSSSMFPSISYTGRVPSDALGTMENETQIVAGTGSQTGTANRWGDYTSMAIDAADDCTFWYTNQYYTVTASFDWSTRLASFKFPGCGQSLRPTTATLAANPPASSTYGTSVTFTATVAPASGTGTPTGTVTFSDGGTNLGTSTLDASGKATFATSTLSAGARAVTAKYGGNSTFGGSVTTPLAYTVTKAGTSTIVSSNDSSPAYGQSVTFTATVSPSAATGTVQFFDGTTSLGTATLSGGQASVSTSTLAVGPHSITATYNGNSNYNTSASGSVPLTVRQAASTTSLASSINPSTLGQSVTFTATVSPSAATGTVQFFDGASSLGTATLGGSKASVSTSNLAVGSHSITAAYSGNANDASSTSPTLTQTVNPASTGDFSLSATPSTQTVVRGSGTTYTATVSAVNGFTGTVSFSASGLPAGATAGFSPSSVTTSGSSTMTVTTGSSTPTGSSTISITATSGAILHITTVTLVVSSPADFTLSASPSSRTVVQGDITTYTATVSAVNGFTGTVIFSASGLPAGASAIFSPTSVSTSGASKMTVTTVSSTPIGSSTITITGTSGGIVHTTTVALDVSSSDD